MPFTFCHPAIILPLTQSKKLSTSALILGSTAPDFEYFIRMDMIRTHSHDFWAIFYFNLPLTLVLVFVFQLIVKQPLINHLPSVLKTRFAKYLNSPTFKWFSIKTIFWISISAITGIFSHLLWDSFTHKEGFFEGHYLLTETFMLFGKEKVVFQFLQIWSSILGGIYIVYFILKIPKSGKHSFLPPIAFWVYAISIAFVVISIRHCDTSSKFIATSIAGGFIGLILTSLLYNFKKHLIKPKP